MAPTTHSKHSDEAACHQTKRSRFSSADDESFEADIFEFTDSRGQGSDYEPPTDESSEEDDLEGEVSERGFSKDEVTEDEYGDPKNDIGDIIQPALVLLVIDAWLRAHERPDFEKRKST
ncbi:hypothetical protein FSARC_6213 [Fusarium sarcochroum]|uniref:Uncharacterized protein n=1 Tax=Fusarium sarcochroum TaxID=1208366 RepID=A0A8H4TXY6_9HYPO|nr:hypothetical protein FSARC_6213 [Fusarium sarcochroum]